MVLFGALQTSVNFESSTPTRKLSRQSNTKCLPVINEISTDGWWNVVHPKTPNICIKDLTNYTNGEMSKRPTRTKASLKKLWKGLSSLGESPKRYWPYI